MILLIDNYDSFVFNLARYFQRLGQTTHVVRNDTTDVDRIRALDPDAIVISPGPCTPHEAGCSLDVVRHLHREVPMLGVCLGHQAIAAALGGEIVRADEPRHGRTSIIQHQQRGLFAGLENPLTVCRYHSLIVDEATLPSCLAVTARTEEGLLMAFQHREHPVFGVQFHPESILTDFGYPLLANFLAAAGQSVTNPLPDKTAELVEPAAVDRPLPAAPVTF